MLNYLTKYLLQYRRVSIPHVGTIHVIQHPPQLNVVDKLIQPPTFSFEFRKGEEVPEHQLNFLNGILNRDKDEILRDLQFFGDKLQEKINGPGFDWEGIGIINRSTQSIPLSINALEPVPAVRVLRQDAKHTVLVGDQEMTASFDSERYMVEAGGKKRSLFVIIGWVLLILSILFIAYYLYTHKFRINATGTKQKPTSYMTVQKEFALRTT